MFQIVKGDIFDVVNSDTSIVAIAHGCNCTHKMGAGIAFIIANNWPQVELADQMTSYGPTKLGTLSMAVVATTRRVPLAVLNWYTQSTPASYINPIPVDYEAIQKCAALTNSMFAGQHIALPRIGSGLAKGDPIRIENILRSELTSCKVTLVDYVPTASVE